MKSITMGILFMALPLLGDVMFWQVNPPEPLYHMANTLDKVSDSHTYYVPSEWFDMIMTTSNPLDRIMLSEIVVSKDYLDWGINDKGKNVEFTWEYLFKRYNPTLKKGVHRDSYYDDDTWEDNTLLWMGEKVK